MRSYLAILIALLSLTVSGETRPVTASFASDSTTCTATAEPSTPLTLADGRIVVLNASGIAQRDRAMLLVGTPAYAWPIGMTTTARGKSGDAARPASGIGVVRDSAGMVRFVESPLPRAKVLHPRVASAGAEGYHVLFVTGTEGTRGDALAFDTASVWYGLYDGRVWRRVTRIASAHSAFLRTGMSSDLVVSRDGLAFAYSFDRSATSRSNARGNQGIVLLQRHGGSWRADTLSTWEGPRAIQLAVDGKGRLLVVFAQSYFSDHRVRGPALFAARHDSGWGTPRLLLDPSPAYVKAPMVDARDGVPSVISWRTAIPGRDEEEIEWGLMSDDHLLVRRGAVASARPIDQPAMVRLADDHAVWFVRAGESRTSLRVLMAGDSGIRDLGTFQVPLDNFAIIGAVLQDGRIRLATFGLATSPSDAPATSYLTELAVRCTAVRG